MARKNSVWSISLLLLVIISSSSSFSQAKQDDDQKEFPINIDAKPLSGNIEQNVFYRESELLLPSLDVLDCSVFEEAQELKEDCLRIVMKVYREYSLQISNNLKTEHIALASLRKFEEDNQNHTLYSLRDQSRRSEIIFWLAIIVMILGLSASYLQLRKSLQESGEKPKEFEILVSDKKFRIRTAWIGVVLLFSSMVFFIIYVYFIYSIKII